MAVTQTVSPVSIRSTLSGTRSTCRRAALTLLSFGFFFHFTAVGHATEQVTVTWQGNSALDSSWGNPQQWNPAIVPNNTAVSHYDVVVPESDQGFGVISLNLNVTVDNLSFLNTDLGLSGTGDLTVNGITRFTATSPYPFAGFVAQGSTFRLGTLTSYEVPGAALNAGTYLAYSTSPSRLATIGFRGADVVVNRATVALFGAGASFRDQDSGADALRHLAVNDGRLTFAGGRNFTTGGDFTNRGTLALGDDQYNIEQNASAPVRFTVAGALTNYDAASHALTGGTFEFNAEFASATLQFAGADIRQNAATIHLFQTGARIVDANGNDALARLTLNQGWLDAFGAGRSFTPDGGTLTNSGTLRAGYGALTVQGGFLQTGGRTELTGLNTNSATFLVQGLMDIRAGRLAFDDRYQAGSSPTLTVQGSLRLAAGAVLTGRGTVAYQGRASLGGTVAPGSMVGELYGPSDNSADNAGGLFFQGALTLEATSDLQIKLGGLQPGYGFDQVLQRDTQDAPGGVLLAGGRLTLTLFNGFVPQGGDSFLVLEADALSGTFGNARAGDNRFEVFDTAGMDVGSFALIYGAGQVSLTDFQAVPEPGVSVWLVLGAGAAAALLIQRRVQMA